MPTLAVLGVKNAALGRGRLAWTFCACGGDADGAIVLATTDRDCRAVLNACWCRGDDDHEGLPPGVTHRRVLDLCREQLRLLETAVPAGSGVNGQLLTPQQVAERWQVSPKTIYKLAAAGEIPCVTLGRCKRFRLDELERYELGKAPDTREAA